MAIRRHTDFANQVIRSNAANQVSRSNAANSGGGKQGGPTYDSASATHLK